MVSQTLVVASIGATRQPAITQANVYPDLCSHMASLGHNEFSMILSEQKVIQNQWWLKQCKSEGFDGCPNQIQIVDFLAHVTLKFSG